VEQLLQRAASKKLADDFSGHRSIRFLSFTP
jgi:hypothetical protein